MSIEHNNLNCCYKKNESYTFISNEFIIEPNNTKSHWFSSGHFLLRNNIPIDLSNVSNENHFDILYSNLDKEFINYIKGNFILLHLTEVGFQIYSDRFAVKKLFYYQNGNKFIISDDLKEISKHVKLVPSCENFAIYTITYHFTGGKTAFHNLNHNTPGQIIEYKDGILQYSTYWKPESLLNIEKRKLNIDEISLILRKTVLDYVAISPNNHYSLSLTGGADTRNLLSIFLREGIKPHLYTYGNPHSNDCVKAKNITEKLDLEHALYDIEMNAGLFEEYARKIVLLSGGLASIHRAHRLIAVQKETLFAEDMFLGTLGGEFIKGVSEDNYIVPSIVYENWNISDFNNDFIRKYLFTKGISATKLDFEALLGFIQNEPYMKGPITVRKLNALSYITAHLHDAQDVNLFNTEMKSIFTPFLDIDYLETIFSSLYTFDQKESKKFKFLKRINNPVYGSQFLKSTYKSLCNFKYSGEHKPSEVIFNKYYAALIKSFRQINAPAYPPNFELGDWMFEFVQKNLPLCSDYILIKETFDLDILLKDLKNSKHIPKESYWLKYTNPIMMRFIIEEFAK